MILCVVMIYFLFLSNKKTISYHLLLMYASEYKKHVKSSSPFTGTLRNHK